MSIIVCTNVNISRFVSCSKTSFRASKKSGSLTRMPVPISSGLSFTEEVPWQNVNGGIDSYDKESIPPMPIFSPGKNTSDSWLQTMF